jgi:hypothetical protein
MHVGDLHGHHGELVFPQNLGAFDCGMDGLCRGSAYDLG